MGMDLVRARGLMMGAACLGALAAGACKARTNTADTARPGASGPADTVVTGAAAADTSTFPSADTANAMTNHPKWSDANIVALLDEANKADSAAGAFAVGKASSPGVKDFARMMMGEHHALRVQGEALVRKLHVTPDLPAEDPLQTPAKSEMEALRTADKGADFDRTYIDQEISIHKAVLALAGKAHSDTQNSELQALIEKAKPVIQKHLDRAEELRKSLDRANT